MTSGGLEEGHMRGLFSFFLVTSLMLHAAASSEAAPRRPAKVFLPRDFVTTYQGSCQLTSFLGDLRFYHPLRIKISKRGVISGTVVIEDEDSEMGELLKVTGRVKPPRNNMARLSMKFADGTRISTTVRRWTAFGRTFTQPDLAKAVHGDYLGQCAFGD